MEGARGPEGPEGESAPADAAKPPRLDEGTGTLVVLGDAGLVGDEFARGWIPQVNGQGGFALVPNVVEWLTGSDDLMSLRTRGAKSRKFKEVEEEKAKAIRWSNYAIAPVALVLAGLMVFFVRRYRK
jgi:ABC-type uncharacterized transport system involved in gliding motility auxiliary subunit